MNPHDRSQNSQKMRIIAFPVQLEDKNIIGIWNLLKKAIQEIQKKNNSGLSFEELYRNAYTLVLQKQGEILYSGTRDVVKEHMKVILEDLVKNLGYEFLPNLISQWKDHQIAMGMIRDILMYLDRVFVPQAKKLDIYLMGLESFRDNVLFDPRIRGTVHSTLLEMVNQDRCGEVVNTHLMKEATQMLVEVGINSLKVYEQEFEVPVLKRTNDFYANESEKFLDETNSVILYVKKVNQRLEEERKRAIQYLDSSTHPKLMRTIEKVLITNHVHRIVDMEGSGLTHMIFNDRYDDISDLYQLMKQAAYDTGLKVMSDCISTYLRSQGAAITQETSNNQPILYIQRLLDLKEKTDTLLNKSLGSEKIFRNQINLDFESFINSNPSAPESLALYLDDKLRRNPRVTSDQESEPVFDRCIGLFRYLQEKDAFERYYKNCLAKRLLFDKNHLDDAERLMISRLKTECGCDFTSKLESMFRDVTLSQGLWNDFQIYLQNVASCPGPELYVRILTTGVWPYSADSLPVEIPSELQMKFDVFSRFYLSKHCGRRLTLMPQLGLVDLSAQFSAPSDQSIVGQSTNPTTKRYILTVSTYQMLVLLKYCDKLEYTFAELQKSTSISEQQLIRALQPLLNKNLRILFKEPKQPKEISTTDSFILNTQFQSKHVKIKALSSICRETEPERFETRQRIDLNRNAVIEAAIMRVMKSRRELEHSQLIAEVTNQLRTRFQPLPLMIKSRIENLLEREYLARKDKDHRVYIYRA